MSASRLPALGIRWASRLSTGLRALASAPPPPPTPSAGGPAGSSATPSSSSTDASSGRAPEKAAPPGVRLHRPPVPAPPPFDDATIDRPPHLPTAPKNLSPLNRPLGVPDVPTPREFGFWELLMPAGNDEFRKAKMQAIMKEFRRSNLGNIMESWRTGGKGWIAPKSIFREDKALYLPNLFGSTLSSGKDRVHTSNLCQGKISIVALAGTEFAYEQVLKFVDPIENRLRDRADFQVVNVSFQSTRLKAFLSSFFANNLRAIVPNGRWDNYIISTQDLKSTLEDQSLGIANNLAGYVYLVDENLKVRWAGCGEPLPEELDALLQSATILLDRHDKVNSRSAPSTKEAEPVSAAASGAGSKAS